MQAVSPGQKLRVGGVGWGNCFSETRWVVGGAGGGSRVQVASLCQNAVGVRGGGGAVACRWPAHVRNKLLCRNGGGGQSRAGGQPMGGGSRVQVASPCQKLLRGEGGGRGESRTGG